MHKEYMLCALEEAKLGRGQCAPNPSVGAVAVRKGTIIGKARHHGAGSPHAERALLSQLPKSNQEPVTLYVSLEPCNHWGRTPPCVDAIIEYGIQRVVYAYTDPNPLVSEKNSPHILQAHGIEVIHYPLAEIDEFYNSYQYWLRTHKPWVTVKIAQTLDGKIAGVNGERRAISNADCFEFTQKQRRNSDVILTTSRTVLKDQPQLNARIPGEVAEAKNVAIIDANLALTSDVRALSLAKQGHIYYDQAQTLKHRQYGCHYHPMPAQQGRIDLAAVLGHLGRLGYHDVWVEAGAQLFAELHHKDLVNQTYVYIAPTILGKDGLNLYADMPALHKAKKVEWQLMSDNVVLKLDW